MEKYINKIGRPAFFLFVMFCVAFFQTARSQDYGMEIDSSEVTRDKTDSFQALNSISQPDSIPLDRDQVSEQRFQSGVFFTTSLSRMSTFIRRNKDLEISRESGISFEPLKEVVSIDRHKFSEDDPVSGTRERLDGTEILVTTFSSHLSTFIRRNQDLRMSRESGSSFEPLNEVVSIERHKLSEDDSVSVTTNRFNWKGAMIQSGLFLGIKHGTRLLQKKTQRELGGPFFRDWGRSVKNLRGWNDGDSPFTNNIAHPLQGSVTGWIFINNSDHAKRQEFGKSKEYWKSRLKAFAWSTIWSTQFEFGPVSEASIGNVGLREKNGHSTMAWTDLVLTPTVGTAFVVLEDIVDKHLLRNRIESKSKRTTLKVKILRSLLTPTASFSNLLRGKYPWKRDNR